MENLLGYDSGNLGGCNISILNARNDTENLWLDKEEISVCAANGTLIWCICHRFEIKSFPYSIFWILKDITPLRKARQTEARLRNNINQTILRRTVQVRDSNVEYRRELNRLRAADVGLLESREKYRVLLQNSKSGVIFVDDDGQISQINPAMHKLLAARNMVDFRQITKKPICHEAGQHGLFSIDDLVRRLATEVLGEKSSLLISLQLSADRNIWFEAHSVRMHVKGFSAAITFIDRTAELRSREREADQQRHLNRIGRISLAGHLSAAMAHELGQPLNASISYTAGIVHHVKAALPDRYDIHDALDSLEAQLHQAGDVLKNVRNFVAAHSPGDELLDLSDLVKTTIDLLQFPLRESDIGIKIEGTQENTIIRGSRVELQQVLVNLISNAIEAMREAKTRRPTIHIEIIPVKDQRIHLRITDNGPGVAKGLSEDIFAPYHSLKTDGLGLGLAMSRNITEAHGGRLWLENKNEYGACFCFSLPTVTRGAQCLSIA